VNALAQVLVKLTSPGVPDTYQGTELWDDSLVDPDNRRPVDWDLRRRLLAELDGLTPEEVVARDDEGLPKLVVVHRALQLRQRRPEVFVPPAGADEGAVSYRALPVAGERAAHLVAFARAEAVVTLAPRLVLGLGGDWRDTTVELPAGAWRDEMTGDVVDGGTVAAAKVLARFPVALLVREDAPEVGRSVEPAQPEGARG
jgi:(1->4)-alpha-D-glucan 1-alpha-D-glucosylmutase